MPTILTKADAIAYLGMDQKTFENYFEVAEEFHCQPRQGRGRFYFSREDLDRWKAERTRRMVELTMGDYSLCLDFALAQHFRGYVLSDWGTARQREFGQKITNWVKGQLAEVAVKKFLEREFNVVVELDFQIHGEIVPQDIIGVLDSGHSRPPRIGIGIKSSKPKSAYLVLGDNEVNLPDRRSDVYVLCRPDLPDDHLLRVTRERIVELVRNEQHFASYGEEIPDFQNIPCEVAGFCAIGELERVTSIPGQEFDGVRHVKKSGLLHRTRQDWQELIRKL